MIQAWLLEVSFTTKFIGGPGESAAKEEQQQLKLRTSSIAPSLGSGCCICFLARFELRIISLLTEDLDHNGVAFGTAAVLQCQDVLASVVSINIFNH